MYATPALEARSRTLKPRHAAIRTLYQPHKAGEILDSKALVLFFPAPHTVTGEDLLELHVHGGIAVVRGILAAIPSAATSERSDPDSRVIRYAEPGEFTRRAFYNDRLDLTQVEALGDTLSAETEQQRRLAVKGASNVLSQRYEAWRQQLLYARGELEALIDFAEDQHFDESPNALIASVTNQVLYLQAQVQAAIKNSSRGELLRRGISIALLGAPNAGKSSLLNCIVGREAAIVSEEAGTTRDVIEIGVDIGGFYSRFEDLAGLRRKSAVANIEVGSIEQEGMRRAKERALVADVVVVLVPIERVRSDDGGSRSHLEINSEVAATLEQCDLKRQSVVYVVNKVDLIGSTEDLPTLQALLQQKISDDNLPPSPLPIMAVSCASAQRQYRDPDCLQHFLKGLTGLFQTLTATSGPDPAAWESSLGATERQRLLLEQCSNDLQIYLDQARQESISPKSDDESVDIVLAAESLRSAADCLAKITGKGEAANVEEVLGVVFENDIRHADGFAPELSQERLATAKVVRRDDQSDSTHRTKLTQLIAFYPVSSAIVRTVYSIYFEIFFNLTPQGQWYNVPAMSRVLLRNNDIYLEFSSTNPQVPVPWQLVKEWAEAMELGLDRGGFCGTYTASIARLTANGLADFWIQMGIGDPIPLAAAAARR
ncbi:MAG: hypothetical protein Q9170_003613 [Blastenia crenularia]